MRKALWFIQMALGVSLSACAVHINDMQFCSPIPGNLGSVCDNFLTSNQKILTQEEWTALQNEWMSKGLSVECTNSEALGNIKREIESLCSKAQCDYQTKTAILNGLSKIQNLGK